MKTTSLIFGCTVVSLLPNLVNADEQRFSWQGKLEAGYVYDSNVTVRELDATTNQSDQAALLDGSLSLKWNPWANLQWNAGINHSETLYRSQDEFDLAITTLHGDLSYDFSAFTVGLSRHDAQADLANQAFMDYQQDAFYLSRLWGARWYTRFALQDIDKTFAQVPERNATARAYTGDLYWFTPSAESYILVGYTYHDETATDPELSYQEPQYRLTWQTQTSGWGGAHRWQLALQWQQRDYAAPMQLLDGEARKEQRFSVRGQWDIPLAAAVTLTPTLEYVDNQSNFDAVDYDETRAGVRLGFRF
ncbi:surface lipoprotein assembly modifier [Pseudidiomarina sp.]|uniref:surface lipoprotein assembly modifier n=1 Tax=Pseudidiomarina sp. TaxID=2081707 RepID=UPI003A987291